MGIKYNYLCITLQDGLVMGISDKINEIVWVPLCSRW